MFLLILFTLLVAISVVGIYYVTRIPKELENIPYVSGLPLALAYMQRKGAHEVQEMICKNVKGHDIYLTYFGVASLVILAKPEYVKILLMEPEDNAVKNTLPESVIGKFFGTGLPLASGDEYRTFKRLSSPAFNNNAAYSDLVGETMKELYTFIKPKVGRPVDAHELMQRVIIQVLGKYALGHDFGILRSEELPYVIKCYNYLMTFASSFFRHAFPWLDHLPTRSNTKLRHSLEYFDEFIYDKIKKKRELVNNNKATTFDFLTSVLEMGKQEGIEVESKQIRDEMSSLFVAANDTTISGLCVTIYYLAKYPEIQEKTRQEVISVVGNKPVYPDPDQLREMKYLSAVIKESLRIHPPVPEITYRKLTKPIKFGPHVLPKDTICLINAWQIHNDPRYWNDPKKYDPERFLRGDKVQQFTWIPFAAGPRRCAGQNLSFAGQRIIIAMLLLKYKLALPEDSINKDQLKLVQQFVVKPVDLKVVFTERK